LANDNSLIGEDFTCSGCNNNDGCNHDDAELDSAFMEEAPSFVFGDFIDSLHVIPNEIQKKNIRRLASKIFQPIHNHFNEPVIIRSGLREKDEKPVKNADTDLHYTGEAADFSVKNISINDVVDYISKNLDYHELIVCNIGGTRPYIHISLKEKENERRLMGWNKGNRICAEAKI